MYNPAISAVIPVYNVEKYLADCLDSILKQSFTDFEIVCVNDGSTDSSLDILEKYASADKRIKIINCQNNGPSFARNEGVKNCKGKYICYIDSDDLIVENAFEIIYKNAEKDNLDILFYANDFIFESDDLKNDLLIKYYKRKNTPVDVVSGEEMFENFLTKSKLLVPVWLMCVKHEFLINSGVSFKIGIIQEDELYTPLLTVEATRAKCITDKLYIQRIRSNSITTSKVSHKNCIGYFVTYTQLIKASENNKHYSERTKKLVEGYGYDIYERSKKIYLNLSKEERAKAWQNMPEEYKKSFSKLIEQCKMEETLTYKIKRTFSNLLKR